MLLFGKVGGSLSAPTHELIPQFSRRFPPTTIVNSSIDVPNKTFFHCYSKSIRTTQKCADKAPKIASTDNCSKSGMIRAAIKSFESAKRGANFSGHFWFSHKSIHHWLFTGRRRPVNGDHRALPHEINVLARTVTSVGNWETFFGERLGFLVELRASFVFFLPQKTSKYNFFLFLP